MRAGTVVVVGIDPENAAQVLHVENNKMVQALSSDRSDQALDMSILSRRTRSRGAIAYAHRSEPAPEHLAVGAVPIPDEISGGCVPRKGLGNLVR